MSKHHTLSKPRQSSVGSRSALCHKKKSIAHYERHIQYKIRNETSESADKTMRRFMRYKVSYFENSDFFGFVSCRLGLDHVRTRKRTEPNRSSLGGKDSGRPRFQVDQSLSFVCLLVWSFRGATHSPHGGIWINVWQLHSIQYTGYKNGWRKKKKENARKEWWSEGNDAIGSIIQRLLLELQSCCTL